MRDELAILLQTTTRKNSVRFIGRGQGLGLGKFDSRARSCAEMRAIFEGNRWTGMELTIEASVFASIRCFARFCPEMSDPLAFPLQSSRDFFGA